MAYCLDFEGLDHLIFSSKGGPLQNIESIRDFGGDDQAAALELLVEKFKKDVDE